MKKLFLAISVLYTANGYAMGARAAAFLLTCGAPVSGIAYYDYKIETAVARAVGSGSCIEAREFRTAKVDYIWGVIKGALPGYNIATLVLETSASSSPSTASKAGFLTGMSCYATLPVAIKLLKYAK